MLVGGIISANYGIQSQAYMVTGHMLPRLLQHGFYEYVFEFVATDRISLKLQFFKFAHGMHEIFDLL